MAICMKGKSLHPYQFAQCAAPSVFAHTFLYASRLALATGRSRGQGRQSVSGSADTHETEEDGPALLDSQWKSLWAVEKVWHQRLPELTGSGQFLHSGKEQDCNRMSQEQLAVYESSTAAILAIKALEAWEQQRSI